MDFHDFSFHSKSRNDEICRYAFYKSKNFYWKIQNMLLEFKKPPKRVAAWNLIVELKCYFISIFLATFGAILGM